MKFRGLLIAVVALGVLGGLTWWSNKAEKAKEGKPAPDAPPKILSISEDQFTGIRLQKTGGDTTILTKDKAGNWQITAPKPLPADQDAVKTLVSTLSSLASDRLVDENTADLGQFGLKTPGLEVDITKKDGKTDKLLVGDDTPTSSGQYAKLESDPRIFTIASYVKSSLDKTSNDLRDKRLLTFDSDKLTRVELLAKGPAIEFGKNNQNDWQILKPKPLRADNSQVEDLVRRLKDARMDTAVSSDDSKKALAAFASGARVATAIVSDASGNQQIELCRDKDKNYYAKSSVVEGVYKVPGDLGDGLDKSLDDFRNKKLFDFGWNDPSKLDIRNGDKSATYQKSGEKWMSGPKQMDSGAVQALIDKLRDLSSIKFLDNGGGAPVFEATVTSNDGKRVEKVVVSKQGNSYFAKRENEPSIYELDGKAVEDLQKAASDIKEAPPQAKKK